MNGKKLKLSDIAELAGVSKSTVSFVLNGHAEKHRINQQTVEKVESIAKKYNYRPSVYARALKSKKTYTVGLVIPDLTNMGFASIAKYLEAKCNQRHYQLIIASSDDNPEQERNAVNAMLDRQVDILLVASSMTDDSFYQTVRQSAPVVLFDRVVDSEELSTIKTDAASATQEVVAKLVKGIDECAYISGQLELSSSIERFEGYKQGLAQAGVSFDPKRVYSKDYQAQSGYVLLEQAFNELNRAPKAVFLASYTLLEGALRYLTEHNLLEQDIRLACFDNYAILDCLPVKVDSIEQDCETIADHLFSVATTLIDEPQSPVQNIVLPAKLHYRR